MMSVDGTIADDAGGSRSTAEARRRRVWILPATGAGDNQQLQCLADALGWPWEVKHGPDPLARVVLDRLASPFVRTLPAAKRVRYLPPWPDLVLLSGGRAVVDAWRIREASGGHSRLVCVGRPWAPLDRFDLVVTTPQYRLPRHPNVLENCAPLQPSANGPSPELIKDWTARLAHLPRPWIAVLVGGTSGSYRFPATFGTRLGQRATAEARRLGGSVLVSTSARTPEATVDALAAELGGVPGFIYRFRPRDPDNPLPVLLGASDRILVTGDSASMVTDACNTGRPVSVLEPPMRLRTRLLTRRWPLGPLSRLRERLVVAGCWVPARDLGRFHCRLREGGWIGDGDDAPPAPASVAALEATVARIRDWYPD